MKANAKDNLSVRPGRINSRSRLNTAERGRGGRDICVVCGKVIPRRPGMPWQEEICEACGEE